MSYEITGVPLPSKPDPQHPIPLRQEFTSWATDQNNAVQFSLFIQALDRFQKMDVTEKLSYYQIAGIHGYPATTWDGAKTPSQGTFYCNHQLTTFPTWHRPYMALYEQRIYEIMLEIVSEIQPGPEKAIWEIEASHWRLPYWDWAASQPYLQDVGIPQFFTMEWISVLMPDHKPKNFKNPLAKFSNPSGKSMGDTSVMKQWAIPKTDNTYPWNECIATSRYGIEGNDNQEIEANRKDWEIGINNFAGSNSGLQAHAWGWRRDGGGPDQSTTIQDCVSRLLSDDYLKSWRTFSSTAHLGEAQLDQPTEFLSLEGIHNNIHDFTGGGDPANGGMGHMSDPSIAAFDPIFFLHHCNVDRQLAMWQTLNPDKWFDNLDPRDNGSQIKLLPFHKDKNFTLFTSDDVRDWTKLGYQYDILENTPRWIRVQAASTNSRVTTDHIASHIRRTVNMHLNTTRQAVLAASKIPEKDNDYLINIIYDRYALRGTAYSLHFFIGVVPDDAKDLLTLSSYVGTVYTFSTPLELDGDGPCENCIKQQKEKVMSRAQVPITATLLDHCENPDIPEFTTMAPAAVEDYLNKHLTWRAVEAATGRHVPLAELPQTKVYVMQGKGEHSDDPTVLSSYGDYGHLWDATSGKAGGATESDLGKHMVVR